MQVSVIIRSKDEADRLRLTLTSLAGQSTAPHEVIVVNDGSSDHTESVLEEAAHWLPLKPIQHAVPHGRSAASNAGARLASGDVLLFVDGDTLGGPDFVACHAAVHEGRAGVVARGETFHLRGTRFLLDPEAGTPRIGEEGRMARMSPQERQRICVTRDQVRHDFASVHRRASPGIYPGIGPGQLSALEMDALRNHPDCSVLWAAASGQNFSVLRENFLTVGGFRDDLDLTEQRELALRLYNAGCRMVFAEGACTYHMTHRVGWRDPLQRADWEQIFYRAHPIPAVKLLSVLWASLADGNRIPEHARITSLPQLEAAARGDTGIDYSEIRTRYLGLPALETSA